MCNCGTFLLDDNAYDLMKIMDTSVMRIIIICPSCGRRSIVGGEQDYDPEWGDCINVFCEDYDHYRHSNLSKVTGIRDFRGVSVSEANWAITGHHKNLGSGILSWHTKKWEARTHARNLKLSDPNAKMEIVTKEEVLQTS